MSRLGSTVAAALALTATVGVMDSTMADDILHRFVDQYDYS